MTLKKLSAATTKKNVAELEDLFLNADLDTSWLDDYYGKRSQVVDVAVATLAQYGNTSLLNDIFEAEELDYNHNSDRWLIRALTEIYALWVDKDAIIAREDNMLHEPDKSNPHWKTLFNYELAKLLVAKGKRMSFDRSIYGWEDYSFGTPKELPPIVALFNIKEDYWADLAGSFATEHDLRTGFTAHVMYSDGTFRDVRYEADLGSIMRELS